MKAQNHFRRFPLVLLFALCCGILLPDTASAQYTSEMAVSLSSFRPDETVEASRYRLRDGDVIMLTQETRSDVPRDQVEIVMRTAAEITWWKEIKLTAATLLGPDHYEVDRRVTIRAYSTQDRFHGLTKPIRFNLRQLSDAYGGIVFSKAKFLGAHTEVYFLSAIDLIEANMGGKRLTFTWQRD